MKNIVKMCIHTWVIIYYTLTLNFLFKSLPRIKYNAVILLNVSSLLNFLIRFSVIYATPVLLLDDVMVISSLVSLVGISSAFYKIYIFYYKNLIPI